jgi:bifunctional DNA-binding transcriptional regulator/antitoxin component of YhaV-PrlF toxin-antitoxin module
MTKTESKSFRIQIVGAKRQMTIPDEMMRDLRLDTGDMIGFTIRDHKIIDARPLKPLPIDMLSDEALESLRLQTAEEVRNGRFEDFSTPDELINAVRPQAFETKKTRSD